MMKHIRTALAALLLAFAIAFSALQLGGFSQMAGTMPKPPKGVVFVLGLVTNEQWPDWSKRKP
jgi:hypothetical protein